MSAIHEAFLLYPYKLSFNTVVPSDLVVLCVGIVGLSIIFANGIVYSCMVETDESSQHAQRQHNRRNLVHFRHHKNSPVLARIGIVSVSLAAIGFTVIVGLKLTLTQRRWVIENVLRRLLICLLSTSAILSEIRGISKYLRWSDSCVSYHRLCC